MEKINGAIKNKDVKAEELKNFIGEEVTIHGSIYKIRKMSGFSFVILRTGAGTVQCIYAQEYLKEDTKEIKEEMCVRLKAYVAEEERSRAGYELRITGVTVLSEPFAEMPVVINNKRVDASLETILDFRPLTLRNTAEMAIFKIQSKITEGFREYFKEKEFTEIHSPKIVSEGAEGGANIFRLDYFGRNAFLAQSPQFYKQMMTGVFERVYEIGPVFRAEKHDTSRHLNEYTSVDAEMGYIESFYDIMNFEAGMLRHVFEKLKNECSDEIKAVQLQQKNNKGTFFEGLVMPDEIPVIKFSHAKELIERKFGRKITDYDDFEPEEEKLLCDYMTENEGSEFVFVTHYPSKKRPFYAMESKENPAETLSFDLLYRGLEITTGGQRIHSYEEQTKKMQRLGMDTELFKSYLLMHKYGMPPHGGFGLGLERLTARILNLPNVRSACAFPRDTKRCEP